MLDETEEITEKSYDNFIIASLVKHLQAQTFQTENVHVADELISLGYKRSDEPQVYIGEDFSSLKAGTYIIGDAKGEEFVKSFDGYEVYRKR